MRRLLRPGDAFIDVGSNVGYFSVVGAEIVGQQGEVHAFEPSQRICGYLKQSIAANSLNNVFANALALWSQSGTLSFAPQRNSGFSYLWAGDVSEAAIRRDVVPADTLDRCVKSSVKRPVKLVKIDVEGAEYHVLTGMNATLQLHSPFLCIEAVDWSLARFGHRIDDLFAFLSSHGYQAYDLQGQSLGDASNAREHLLNARLRTCFSRRS